ncbi:transporter, major facilitator family protein [Clostridiales bacterium oral taxon 876 str. F0540]|nr:transporter, major facilitator family protein [Clostridiales bacterium oral taxon 876 str. F0540]
MENNIRLKRNVYKNYIFTLLQSLDFTRGIWMIYLASKGMSLTQLGLLETIFHTTSFLMEVPTGAVADLFGRKISRILGRVLSLISVILLLTANSFLWFAVSFVFTALSYNLESGAGDALIYDSLKEIGEEEKYMKINGNKELFYQSAGIISFFVGGYLATKSYNIAFLLTVVIGIITIVQSLTFKEPSVGRVNTKEENENIFVKQLKESIKVVISKPKVGFLILFTQVIMAFCTCIFFYLQNYLKGNGYTEWRIGIIYAISSLTVALLATQVHSIEKRIKEQGLLLIVPFFTVVCIWGVALSKYNYMFFILLMLTEEIIYVSMSDYVNKMIPSENRATILSFASMVFSFFMITLFPFIGLIGDKFNLTTAFKCLAMLGSILVIVNAVILISRKRNNAK